MDFHYYKRPKKGKRYKGVYVVKVRGKKYITARIFLHGKCHSLGYFNSQKKAAMAYNKAAIRLFGEGCYLNLQHSKIIQILYKY